MTQGQGNYSWHWRAIIISIIVASLGYLVFSLLAGWKEVSHAIIKVGFVGVIIVLCLSLINYALRFIRWKKYLEIFGHYVPAVENAQIYLAGFALTTTPGKAGEALRSFLLKPYNVPFRHSLAALLSERLSDLIAVVLLAFIGISQYSTARPFIILSTILILFGLFIISNARLLNWILNKTTNSTKRIVIFLSQLCHILLEARRCHSIGTIIVSTALSIFAWGAEACAFYFILQWMGADISVSFAIFIYALAMLAGALSFMPGGLGGAEAVMIGLLIFKGINSADAVAATVLIRFATLWFAVGIGIIVLLTKIRTKDIASE